MAVSSAVAATLLLLHTRRDDRLGVRAIHADDFRGVLVAERPAALAGLAAGARRDVAFAPADPAVAVAHLDDDRLELVEGPIGQHIRPDQRQADLPQHDLSQLHGLSSMHLRTYLELNAARLDGDRPFLDFAGDKFGEIFRRSAFGRDQIGADASKPLLHGRRVHGGDRGAVKLPDNRVRRAFRQEQGIPARNIEIGQTLLMRRWQVGMLGERFLLKIASAFTVLPAICGMAVGALGHW